MYLFTRSHTHWHTDNFMNTHKTTHTTTHGNAYAKLALRLVCACHRFEGRLISRASLFLFSSTHPPLEANTSALAPVGNKTAFAATQQAHGLTSLPGPSSRASRPKKHEHEKPTGAGTTAADAAHVASENGPRSACTCGRNVESRGTPRGARQPTQAQSLPNQPRKPARVGTEHGAGGPQPDTKDHPKWVGNGGHAVAELEQFRYPGKRAHAVEQAKRPIKRARN
jgi:hypothetical protein